MTDTFARLVRNGELAVCGLGQTQGNQGFLDVAKEVREANDRIGDMDVIIIASALNCGDCRFFFTDDRDILVSDELTNVAQKHHVEIQDPTSVGQS